MLQIYVNVDNKGNIMESLIGENIIPDRAFQFFFLDEQEVASNIRNYKVVLEGFTPKLQLIEG